MKLYIFGSCSGTEPMEGRHHTSFALEVEGKIYWFDAGENCSYTAHLMGVDLLSVSNVFISHPHMDHVGGLGNLLWNIRKLSTMTKVLPRYGDITLYMPNEDTFEGIMTVLKATEGGYKTDLSEIVKEIEPVGGTQILSNNLIDDMDKGRYLTLVPQMESATELN